MAECDSVKRGYGECVIVQKKRTEISNLQAENQGLVKENDAFTAEIHDLQADKKKLQADFCEAVESTVECLELCNTLSRRITKFTEFLNDAYCPRCIDAGVEYDDDTDCDWCAERNRLFSDDVDKETPETIESNYSIGAGECRKEFFKNEE